MKRMLILGLYGIVVFGVSAGGAWMMHSRHQEELAQERAKNQPDEDEQLVPMSTSPSVLNPELSDLSGAGAAQKIPVEYQGMTMEEMVAAGFNLQKQAIAIREREDALNRVQAQYQLVLEDIKYHQVEVQALMQQARRHNDMAAEALEKAGTQEQSAKAALDQAMQKEQQAEQRIQEAEKARQETQKTSQASEQFAGLSRPQQASAEDLAASTKELAATIQGMEPDVGADLLMSYMSAGDVDMATSLAAKMAQPKLAELLQAMHQKDPKKAMQLTTAYRNMPRPQKKKGKRR